MKKTMISMALLMLIGVPGGFAQSGSKETTVGTTIHGTVPEAPVGHRQPRAGDIPDEKNLSNPIDALDKENALLDKKIKSICRGC